MTTSSDSVVLLATTRDDLHADLIVAELLRRNAKFLRWNCEDFPGSSLVSWDPVHGTGTVRTPRGEWSLNSFRSVWYRRTPVAALAARDPAIQSFVLTESSASLDGIWATMQCSWINRPANVRCAENKLRQLQVASRLGLDVPRTIVTNDPTAAEGFARAVGASVAKTIVTAAVASGSMRRRIYAREVSEGDLQEEERVHASPFFLQERIRKDADIRVTVIGPHAFVAAIRVSGDATVDWRAAAPQRVAYERHQLPSDTLRKCRALVAEFELTYGCLDLIRKPSGEYVFLEINPSGQWGWIEEALEFPITKILVDQLLKPEQTRKPT